MKSAIAIVLSVLGISFYARAGEPDGAQLLICIGETAGRYISVFKAADPARKTWNEQTLIQVSGHSCAEELWPQNGSVARAAASIRLLQSPEFWEVVTNEVRKTERYMGITPAGPVQDE
jgi:hypothetical protein